MQGITTQFREIVETQQSRVFSIAFRILGDYGAAQEVAQDVFLELHRTLVTLSSEEHLTPWLRRVTVHRAIDALRRRSRILHDALEFSDELGGSLCHQTSASPLASPLESLLLTLPPAQRTVVLLRYQEDLAPAEIAEALGMPVATVKSHLQRALKSLRAQAEPLRKECTSRG